VVDYGNQINPATGKSMRNMHLGSGLGYLESASYGLGRLQLQSQAVECREILKEEKSRETQASQARS
jgi:hypothetical protein